MTDSFADRKPETLEEFAQHYVEVIYGRPNGWGQYVSKWYGQSHDIMRAAYVAFGMKTPVQEAFNEAIRKHESKQE